MLSELPDTKYVSIIDDEATDEHANREILTLYIGSVDSTTTEPEIKEVFLDFIHIEKSTGKKLTREIFTSP